MKETPYSILGLTPNATEEEIKGAYRRLAAQHHPDKGGDEVEFIKVKLAYDALVDPDARVRFDAYMGDDAAHQHRKLVEGMAAKVFMEVVNASDTHDLQYRDPLDNCRQAIEQTIVTLRSALRGAHNQRRKLRMVAQRVKGPATSPLVKHVREHRFLVWRNYRAIQQQLRLLPEVLEYLQHFGYTVDGQVSGFLGWTPVGLPAGAIVYTRDFG